MREIGSLGAGQVEPMTYSIDTCHFLAWCLTLIGYGKYWLAQCHDNVTELGYRLMVLAAYFLVKQHYKLAIAVHCHETLAVLITLDVPWT